METSKAQTLPHDVDPWGKGGYDIGYRSAPLFWDDSPASLVRSNFEGVDLTGKRVLDLGCGEGKNAGYLARLGASVHAIDVSAPALENAERRWSGEALDLQFSQADVTELRLVPDSYDMVISYGLLHCLGGHTGAAALSEVTKRATASGGVHIVCALNSRLDGFSEGHLGFRPVLLSHHTYLAFYSDWVIREASDRNLTESHPPNHVTHTHAATRFVATKP